MNALMLYYPVICTHLESLASEESVTKPTDKVCFKGCLKKSTSFIFVLCSFLTHFLILYQLCYVTFRDTSDLPCALASLEAFYIAIQSLKSDDPARPSHLSKFVASSVDTDHLRFRGIKLSGAHCDILAVFNNSRASYIDALENCLSGQFSQVF